MNVVILGVVAANFSAAIAVPALTLLGLALLVVALLGWQSDQSGTSLAAPRLCALQPAMASLTVRPSSLGLLSAPSRAPPMAKTIQRALVRAFSRHGGCSPALR